MQVEGPTYLSTLRQLTRLPSSLHPTQRAGLPMTRPSAVPNANRQYTLHLRVPPSVPNPTGRSAVIMSASAPTRVFPQSTNMATASLTHHAHNRDLALQKYVLLQEQHESLRQHLDELRPLQNPFGSAASPTSSITSQVRTGSIASLSSSGDIFPYQSTTCRPYRRVSLPLPKMSCSGAGLGLETLPDETAISEVAVEEAKLCDVNEGIKRTLTELLNCEAVREDRAFRTWVQGRLMDTERELRSGRRRRSAPEPCP